MKNNRSLSWQIGASFIGTVIGAGFASGQEIMFFFTNYGKIGFITLLLSGLIFSLTAYGIFYTSLRLKTYNYSDYINKIFGNKLAVIYDFIISIFLFLGTSIMFSGSGALFKENLQLPKYFGVLLIAVITLLIVITSVKGILKINSLVVPVILVTIAAVFFKTFNTMDASTIVNNTSLIKASSGLKPFFAVLFYCSYNLTLSIGVLSAFCEKITDISVLKKGAIIGGLGLMLLSGLLNICLIMNIPEVLSLSMPILYIIKGFNPIIKYAVIICIWCEILTTAIANAFSLSKRISKQSTKLNSISALFIIVACLPLAFFDFKKLVAFFYPLFGALSIFLIISILYVFTKYKIYSYADK